MHVAGWIEQKKKHLFVQGDDGYWVYWPDDYNGGALPAYALRALADMLDEMNKDIK
jgi:hypothetical protein